MNRFIGEKLFSQLGNGEKEIFSQEEFEKIWQNKNFWLREETEVYIKTSVSLENFSREILLKLRFDDAVFCSIGKTLCDVSRYFQRLLNGENIFPTTTQIALRHKYMKMSNEIIFQFEDLEKIFIFTFSRVAEKKWKLYTSIQARKFPD